jgi:hypothetical protein
MKAGREIKFLIENEDPFFQILSGGIPNQHPSIRPTEFLEKPLTCQILGIGGDTDGLSPARMISKHFAIGVRLANAAIESKVLRPACSNRFR